MEKLIGTKKYKVQKKFNRKGYLLAPKCTSIAKLETS